jgi:hypothetical protein
MKSDPIVDEVRAARDTIARRHEYDVDAICEALRAVAKDSGEARVVFPARRVTPGTVAGAQQGVAPVEGSSSKGK